MPFVPLLAAPAAAQLPAPGAAALRTDDDDLARRAAAFRNGALAGRNGNPETGNAAPRRRILECR